MLRDWVKSDALRVAFGHSLSALDIMAMILDVRVAERNGVLPPEAPT